MKKLKSIREATYTTWSVYPVVGCETIDNTLMEALHTYTTNGLDFDVDFALENDLPFAWDSSFHIEGGNLVIQGGVGPSGFGEVRISVPLPRDENGAGYRWFLDLDEEDFMLADELRELGYLVITE